MQVSVLSLEFLVHAWDFAKATRREVVVSEPVSKYVLGAGKVITPEARCYAGFADPVETTPDVGALDRLIAFTGRQPAIAKRPLTNERSVMPKKTEYAQGTPCWIDLQTTDQSGGKKFYTSLLGWSYDDRSMPGTSAVYSMALLSGETVAAIAPMPPGAPEGMPPMWNTYLAVDDVDAAAEKVVPAGGQVLMPPMDIVDSGRMAFVADPTGATVGLWQANQHIGATLVNEPGTLIWNELITDKPDSALAFYEAVVGLTHSTMEMAPGEQYRVLKAGGTDVGGCMEPPMPDVPNCWHVYFAVDDTDAFAAKATAEGGQVTAEPFDVPGVGRIAVLTDPHGAVFSVMTPAPQQ
jgi:hypothetical protein